MDSGDLYQMGRHDWYHFKSITLRGNLLPMDLFYFSVRKAILIKKHSWRIQLNQRVLPFKPFYLSIIQSRFIHSIYLSIESRYIILFLLIIRKVVICLLIYPS